MDLKWLPIIRIWFKDLQLFPICRIRLPRITRNFQNLQSALAILWESCCLLATAWWVIVSPEGAWCSFKSYPILLLMKAAPSIDNVPFSSVAFILYKHQTDFFLVQTSNFIFQLSRKIIAALMTLLLYT